MPTDAGQLDRTTRGWRVFLAIPYGTALGAMAWMAWFAGVFASVNWVASLVFAMLAGALASGALWLFVWAFGHRRPRELLRKATWTAFAIAGAVFLSYLPLMI